MMFQNKKALLGDRANGTARDCNNKSFVPPLTGLRKDKYLCVVNSFLDRNVLLRWQIAAVLQAVCIIFLLAGGVK